MALSPPRLSIRTALFLITIVAMAIAIWQLWREVEPLRQEVRRLRLETGHLTIDDPTKAYATSVPTFEEDTWKWRVYLPPGNNFVVNTFSGNLPPRSKYPSDSWYGAIRTEGSGGKATLSPIDGEFVLEVKLAKREIGWILSTRCRKQSDSVSSSSATKLSISGPDDWLSNERPRITSSAVGPSQKSFAANGSVLLLHVMRPEITDLPGGGSRSKAPSGPADGFVIWIEPRGVAAP